MASTAVHPARKVNLDPDVRAVLRIQGWASTALWLAVLLGVATGLFITFFQYDSWRTEAFEWALEEDQHEIAAHILTGKWMNLQWQEWAAIGAVGTGTLLLLGIGGYRRCGTMMREIPGLASAVREERKRRNEEKWALVGCLLILLFLPFVIAYAASRSDD